MMRLECVDISLTTIQRRLPTLRAVLASLLGQSSRLGKVYLFISREAYLLDEGIEEIPEDLLELQVQSQGRLQIEYVPNIGSYRKILPYLEKHAGEDGLVVIADDDAIYPEDWLDGLIRAYEKYGCTIAYRGHRMVVREEGFAPYNEWIKAPHVQNPSMLIVPTGNSGVLYRTSFFHPNVLNTVDCMAVAPSSDDLWLRWHVALNGGQVFLIDDVSKEVGEVYHYSTTLFRKFNKKGANDLAIQELEAYFEKKFGFLMAKTT